MGTLRDLIDEKANAFRSQFAGRVFSFVTLNGGNADQTPALSANFLKVKIGGAIPANCMVEACISHHSDNSTLTGQIIPKRGPGLLHRN